jgi:[ribosomal protein S5]-alanine N-acetyltransferase
MYTENNGVLSLSSPRLLLSDVQMKHLPDVHLLLSLPETDRYNTSGIPVSVDETEEIMHSWLAARQAETAQAYALVIHEKSTGNFIGLIGLKMGKLHYRNAEAWFKISPQYWGKGFATEALQTIIGFGFHHLHLHRIEAGCAVENIASYKVMEKAGMLREGRKRKLLPIRGEWKDNFSYAILEEDFVQA